MHEKQFPFKEWAKLESDERKERQPAEAIVRLIGELSPRTVLEVGVGTGYFALPLLDSLAEVRLIALDVEPRMLAFFEERLVERGARGRVELVEGAIDSAGGVAALAERSVDVALMANLYHELDDRSAALTELRRLLRAGGSLIVCDWDPSGAAEFGPPLDHRVQSGDVEREVIAAGFSKVERRPLYRAHYTLLAA